MFIINARTAVSFYFVIYSYRIKYFGINMSKKCVNNLRLEFSTYFYRILQPYSTLKDKSDY